MQNENGSTRDATQGINLTMQAIILLGGKGTRISRLFPDRPKALAPVAGQPFLERQLAWLVRVGITNVHLAAGYRAEHLLAWLCQAETGSQRSKARGQRPEIRNQQAICWKRRTPVSYQLFDTIDFLL